MGSILLLLSVIEHIFHQEAMFTLGLGIAMILTVIAYRIGQLTEKLKNNP